MRSLVLESFLIGAGLKPTTGKHQVEIDSATFGEVEVILEWFVITQPPAGAY